MELLKHLILFHALAKPVSEFVLGEVSCGEGDEGDNHFCVARIKRVSIEHQESFTYHRSRSFIAIAERVVARDAERIGRSKRSGVWLAVIREIARPCHRAFESSRIADAVAPTMLSELLRVSSQGYLGGDPSPALGHKRPRILVMPA